MESEKTHILNPLQAADLLGIKISTIYKWVHYRKIPYRKHGRLLKFERSTLMMWSKSQEINLLPLRQ